MTLRHGSVYSCSMKQKLVTKSSTEAKIVGATDVLPQQLWTNRFLEAQGYAIDSSVMYQDNQSTTHLEHNRRGSSGKRTRHMDVQFFFVMDRLEAGEIMLE
eukprot:9167602-Ditylum_brightwellii.AAC.1